MITRKSVPPDGPIPPHIVEVGVALEGLHDRIQELWTGNGIDGRKVARMLDDALPSWSLEQAGSLRALTWDGARIRPFLVDGDHGAGRSILEIEGGGALQNNRLHRDLLNSMLLDDVEHLVLVVPNWVHNRSPFDYAVAFASRLRTKGLLSATTTVFGYGVPPHRKDSTRPEAGRD